MLSLNVIILSNTVNKAIYEMTLNCIDSLLKSEEGSEGIQIDVLLVESNGNYLQKGFSYPDYVTVIVPEGRFNFHKFLNIGIRQSNHDFIALCNNDLIFQEYWFSEILKVQKHNTEIMSFSPIDPDSAFTSGKMFQKKEYLLGYQVRKHIAGWCLVADKELFNKIGLLDERFDFYYADDDYSMTLRKHNIKHALVAKSKVIHLGGKVTKETNNPKESPNLEFDLFKDLPKYLYRPGYKWILNNEKMLDAHIKFHEKWGGIQAIAIKNRLTNVLAKAGQGWVSKFLY